MGSGPRGGALPSFRGALPSFRGALPSFHCRGALPSFRCLLPTGIATASKLGRPCASDETNRLRRRLGRWRDRCRNNSHTTPWTSRERSGPRGGAWPSFRCLGALPSFRCRLQTRTVSGRMSPSILPDPNPRDIPRPPAAVRMGAVVLDEVPEIATTTNMLRTTTTYHGTTDRTETTRTSRPRLPAAINTLSPTARRSGTDRKTTLFFYSRLRAPRARPTGPLLGLGNPNSAVHRAVSPCTRPKQNS